MSLKGIGKNTLWLSLSLFALVSCSKARVAVSNFDHGFIFPWKGHFMGSPEAYVEIQGKHLGSLQFLPRRAVIEVEDREQPEFLWTAVLEGIASQGNSLTVLCEKVIVFSIDPRSGERTAVYARSRQQRKVREGWEERVEKYLDKSVASKFWVPRGVRLCQGEKVNLRREVLPGGDLQLQWESSEGAPPLLSATSMGIAKVLEPLDLEVPLISWSDRGALKDGRVIEDPHYRYYPVPATRRLFGLWEASEGDSPKQLNLKPVQVKDFSLSDETEAKPFSLRPRWGFLSLRPVAASWARGEKREPVDLFPATAPDADSSQLEIPAGVDSLVMEYALPGGQLIEQKILMNVRVNSSYGVYRKKSQSIR